MKQEQNKIRALSLLNETHIPNWARIEIINRMNKPRFDIWIKQQNLPWKLTEQLENLNGY